MKKKDDTEVNLPPESVTTQAGGMNSVVRESVTTQAHDVKGFVLVWRKLRDSRISQYHPLYLSVWLEIICGASYTDKEHYVGAFVVTIQRGQFLASYRSLCETVSYIENRVRAVPSVKKMRLIIKTLKDLRMIATESGIHTGGLLLITILNYGQYQTRSRTEGQGVNPELGQGLGQAKTRADKGVETNQGQGLGQGVNPELGQDKDRGRAAIKRINKELIIKTTTAAPVEKSGFIKIPEDLKGLDLYETDEDLCLNWEELKSVWEKTYSYLDILLEVKKAHAYQFTHNRNIQPKTFILSWLNRARSSSPGNNFENNRGGVGSAGSSGNSCQNRANGESKWGTQAGIDLPECKEIV